MILESAPLQVKPGRYGEFEAAFAQAQRIIASMPGYRGHELHRCVEREGHYLLLVRWESVAAHEEGFRKSAGYQEWKRLLHHFYDPFPTVLHYDPVIVADATSVGLARVQRRSLGFFGTSVGGLATLAGVGLALFGLVLVWGALVKSPIDAGQLGWAAAPLVTGAFCLFVGLRLLQQRPDRYGSVLPPWGWNLLGVVFAALTLFVAYIGIRAGMSFQSLYALVFAAAFSGGCFWRARWLVARRQGP